MTLNPIQFALLAMVAFIAGIGCQSQGSGPTRVNASSFRANPMVKPGDPVPHPIYLVQLDVYQIEVPFGSVSENESFWSRISQRHTDPHAEALLRRNGFHIGEGTLSDWPFFRDILDKNPTHTVTMSFVAYQERDVPLITRYNQPARNLFYFDASGQLVGRSFNESDDEIMLSFWPTLRHDGQLHIKLVPVVRSQQSHLRYHSVEGEPAIETVTPEYIYDLKLESDIDVDHFLIIAPSPQARLESSLGNAFLVQNGSSRTETILIFVARPIGARSLVKSSKTK
ncbi:MAG TPA: hypothetical protein VG722_07775 [Tepidisphaeraceae bacterium]|nr:hypothetical protein [Tepidisphaeraceae bacterium]